MRYYKKTTPLPSFTEAMKTMAGIKRNEELFSMNSFTSLTSIRSMSARDAFGKKFILAYIKLLSVIEDIKVILDKNEEGMLSALNTQKKAYFHYVISDDVLYKLRIKEQRSVTLTDKQREYILSHKSNYKRFLTDRVIDEVRIYNNLFHKVLPVFEIPPIDDTEIKLVAKNRVLFEIGNPNESL